MKNFIDLIGYEGIYKINIWGNIMRIHGKKKGILKSNFDRLGYEQIRLTDKYFKRKNHKIHRLIAINFIDNPNNKPEVNHKDGIKSNNNIENLEWVTRSENLIHSFRILKNKPAQKDKKYGQHNTSKPILQYDLEGKLIREWDCTKRAIDETGITHIYCNINNPKIFKTAGGYIWKRKG